MDLNCSGMSAGGVGMPAGAGGAPVGVAAAGALGAVGAAVDAPAVVGFGSGGRGNPPPPGGLGNASVGACAATPSSPGDVPPAISSASCAAFSSISGFEVRTLHSNLVVHSLFSDNSLTDTLSSPSKFSVKVTPNL